MISRLSKQSPRRIGFVPLSDAAPWLVAEELGLYEKQGLKVALGREASAGSLHLISLDFFHSFLERERCALSDRQPPKEAHAS